MNFINAQLPPKANGKPHTNKDYEVQGWNAAEAGVAELDCPYIHTSTAEKHWLKGHRSAQPKRARTVTFVIGETDMEYQGHRSWNAWNVSLYIANEEPLYRAGVDACRRSKNWRMAVVRFYQMTGLNSTAKTPDGAVYNVLSVKLALQGLEEPLAS